MKQTDDFKKAVEKKIKSNVGFMFFLGVVAYLFFWASSSFYNVDSDLFLIMIFSGGIFSMFLLMILIGTLRFKHNPKKLDKYELCRRCKCLIEKDKVFCNDCKERIEKVVKYEEDKKSINEYKILIKQEEKKNKRNDN